MQGRSRVNQFIAERKKFPIEAFLYRLQARRTPVESAVETNKQQTRNSSHKTNSNLEKLQVHQKGIPGSSDTLNHIIFISGMVCDPNVETMSEAATWQIFTL